MNDIEPFTRAGTAILIGLMLGLQREYAHRDGPELFAGARSFALLALLGWCGAWLNNEADAIWPLLVVFIAVGILIAQAYRRSAKAGMTTEIAALIAVLLGALCYTADLALTIAVGIAVAVLLELKLHTQRLVRQLTEQDVLATLKFAVISVIILPILPRAGYGPDPWNLLVPYEIWLMVVFISAIGFCGYLASKLLGTEQGIALTGLLAGIVSSTALTLSFAQRARQQRSLSHLLAMAILLAWGTMFVRVAIEVWVINAALLGALWLPLLLGLGTCIAAGAIMWRRSERGGPAPEHALTNPFELTPAVTFGLIYAGISLAVQVLPRYLGDTGIYVTSLVAGIADVDAITLNLARLTAPDSGGATSFDVASHGIVLALTANTVAKGAIASMAGGIAFARRLLPATVGIAVAPLAAVWLT